MKKFNLFLFVLLAFIFLEQNINAQSKGNLWQVKKTKDGKVAIINTAADNMKYWMRLAEKGIIPYNPNVKTGDTVFLGTKIQTSLTDFEDSPDVATNSNNNNTQTETSIFINPNNNEQILNSNNSTSWASGSAGEVLGTSSFISSDGAQTWDGAIEGTGGQNNGDPAVAIDLNGRMYSGFIHSGGGQGVAYSADNGMTWTSVLVEDLQYNGLLDKNHLWVDNSYNSPYVGNVYTAWTNLDGGDNETQICISYSEDGGLTYSNSVEISSEVNAGSHNQGVNIQTGPNGEVYVVWAIYDNWLSTGYEQAIGFTKSLDGGKTWSEAERIIDDIRGIRAEPPTAHRVNSFPSMAADINSGNIYVVWANYGVPGNNSGNSIGVFMLKSTDNGETWSEPIQVSQAPLVSDNASYLPWISCDPSSGSLSVIYYDTRNTSGNDVETWVAISLDEGETWEDFRVSDVSFTTKAVPGLAAEYMGDYLGITSFNSTVYPVWSDDRTGVFKAYVSPFSINKRPRPFNFDAQIIDEQTGLTELTWDFEDETNTLDKFNVYSNGMFLGHTSENNYSTYLSGYGVHKLQVAALHTDGESAKVSKNIKWGKALIDINPSEIIDTLALEQSSTHSLNITNNGELDLIYSLKKEIITNKKDDLVYCEASGGGDEYISGVIFGNINNTNTNADGYHDYTYFKTDVLPSETYELTVYNGNPYNGDDWSVWIDWNQDGDFDDANENPICQNDGSEQITWSITVPENALAGETRMRIRLLHSYSDCGEPCGSTTYGEVEDYTLNVIAWLQTDVQTNTILPGQTVTIPVTLNVNDFLPDTYNANLIFYSNAANDDTSIVPVTMVVEGNLPLSVNPSAIPQNICQGETVTLYANLTGGDNNENVTYSWTDNNTFTSSEKNPTVNPTETTTYYLTVNIDNEIFNGQITVDVNDLPEVPDMPSGSTSFDNNSEIIEFTTNNVPNTLNYEWSIVPQEAGLISGIGTTGYFDPNDNFSGNAQIFVKSINSCGYSELSEGLNVEIKQSLDIIPNEISLNLYPNPTDGKFILSLNSKLEDYLNIQIYNMAGKLIYSDLQHYFVADNSISFDLSDQPSGIYIINVAGKLVNENIKIVIR